MSKSNQRATITVDQEAALRAAGDSLAAQFDGTFDRKAIDDALHAAYFDLVSAATVPNYLPLLAEKRARRSLRSRVRRDTQQAPTAPVVGFLCVHNAGRSQMALGFFRKHASSAIGWSAGCDPAGAVSPVAAAVMLECGIDITSERPTRYTEALLRSADVLVDLSRGAIAFPRHLEASRHTWIFPDPAVWDAERVRPIRDEIEHRVVGLVDELGLRS